MYRVRVVRRTCRDARLVPFGVRRVLRIGSLYRVRCDRFYSRVVRLCVIFVFRRGVTMSVVRL